MSEGTLRVERTWGRIRIVALVVLAAYLLLGVLMIASAWADAQSSASIAVPRPASPQYRPPSGNSDVVVRQYYDYLQEQTYETLPETYHLDVNSLLIIYAVLGINIGGLYVFAYMWYTGKLRRNDLYPAEIYNGYVAERGSPFDIFNYYVWAVMFAYIVVYIVVSLIYGQLY